MATLTACIVQALDGSQVGVRTRFLDNLERAYANLREGPLAHTGAMETLKWTRDILEELP